MTWRRVLTTASAAAVAVVVVLQLVATQHSAPGGESQAPSTDATRSGNPSPPATIEVAFGGSGYELDIVDHSGVLLAARSLIREELQVADAGVAQQGSNAMYLRWADSPCESRGRLTISAGTEIDLELAPAAACDAIVLPRGIELTFARPVDASKISFAIREGGLVATRDLLPTTVLAGDWGPVSYWVAGTTEASDAVAVLVTNERQRLFGLGRGSVIDLAAAGEDIFAVVACEITQPACRPGLYEGGSAGFARIQEGFLQISLDGTRGLGITDVGGVQGLAFSRDSGGTWASITSPCSADVGIADSAVARNELFVICAAAGNMRVDHLSHSHDDGVSWQTIDLPPETGVVLGFEFFSDGRGWLWSRDPTAIIATLDGLTWDSVSLDGLAPGGVLSVSLAADGALALVAPIAKPGTPIAYSHTRGIQGNWRPVPNWPELQREP